MLHIHYRSKVWGHLEMSLFFKEKHCFVNKDNINHKYPLYIVNVVNDSSRWNVWFLMKYLQRCIEAHFIITPVF